MRRLETLARDLSYGARLFRRQPGSTLLAVITLSLGVGANAVIYSLLHAVLLRPLPFPDAHRLVAVVDNFRAGGQSNVPPTVLSFVVWKGNPAMPTTVRRVAGNASRSAMHEARIVTSPPGSRWASDAIFSSMTISPGPSASRPRGA